MRTLFSLLVSSSLLIASLASAAPKLLPFTIKKTTLKNGLTVVRVPTPSNGLIAYYSVVRTGSRNEVEAGHTGFAHFFEHVMFKGTKNWPEGTRDALLGKLGFSENAFTSDDVTVYHQSGPASALQQVVEVEADRFAHLEFSEQTFQTESKAVLGEYHKNAANPGLKTEEALLAAAFRSHPYRHTTLGFYEDVQAMPGMYEYSKQFFARWYTPDNVMVFVVGDFDDAKLMQWVEKQYGPWKGKAATVEIPVEPAQAGPRNADVEWKTMTLPRHAVYWKVPAASLTTNDAAVQMVLGAYLAGPVSPLYKSLVLEKQLVDGLSPDESIHRDPYLFGLHATLKDEKNRAEVEAAMLSAVADVAKTVPEAARVKAIQDHLKYELLTSFETPDQIASHLSYAAGVLGSPEALETLHEAVAKVKPADLQAFAKKYFTNENRTTMRLTVAAKGSAQ